jgi:HNH endonuclease
VEFRILKEGYRVGPDGTVQSSMTRGPHPRPGAEWRPLKPVANDKGCLKVDLGRGDTRYVADLVLRDFVGPRPAGKFIRYADGNKANCALENLFYGEWPIRGEGHHRSTIDTTTARLARRIRRETGIGATRIARILECSEGTAHGILSGTSWRTA